MNELAHFHIVKEKSIGAGLRRIRIVLDANQVAPRQSFMESRLQPGLVNCFGCKDHYSSSSEKTRLKPPIQDIVLFYDRLKFMIMKEYEQANQLIERYYDKQSEREWQRMDRHRTEFAVTLRALNDHLPPPPARLLDCGGGPGRYAVEMARLGYDVTLFDLSVENLALARTKAQEAGIMLSAYERGTATDLSRFENGAFDVVLLMGPLYHLLKVKERRQALAEAKRVLRSDGLFFAAFISRYAALRYAAANEPNWPLEYPEAFESVLETGIMPPRDEDGMNFIGYFAHPTEVIPLCEGAGFEIITVLGVEGLVSVIESQVNALDGEIWELWVDLNYRVASDPCIHGCVEHLLVIARNPQL